MDRCHYILAERREYVYKVVRLSLVHQSGDGTRAGKSSFEHGLEQRVWSNLNDDSVVWNVLKCLVEQHWTNEVVHVVVGRGVAC